MDLTLTAETGRTTGTRPARRLRAEGKVPGVVYGLDREPVSVAVPWPELRRALTTEAGLNALITLEVDGHHDLTIVKDLQRDPVRRAVTHVDFLRIDRDASDLRRRAGRPAWARPTRSRVDQGIVEQLLHTPAHHLQARRHPVPARGRHQRASRSVARCASATSPCPRASPPTSTPEEQIAIASATRAAEAEGRPSAKASRARAAKVPRARRRRRRGRRRLRRRRVAARRARRVAPGRLTHGRPAGGRAGQPRRRVRRDAATTSASTWSTCWSQRHGGRLRSAGRERALVDEVRIGGRRVALAEPQTYMNESGVAVAPAGAALRHRRPRPGWWWSTTSSTCRSGGCEVKLGGGLAGHNGLRSIKAHLHDDAFVRVRIGVGKPPSQGAGRRPRAQASRPRPSGRVAGRDGRAGRRRGRVDRRGAASRPP